MVNALRKIMTGAFVSLAISAPSLSAETLTLRYSNWLPPGHLLEGVFNQWFEDVERVTEGRVTFTTFPKVVGSVPAQLDVVADGQADLAFFVAAYKPGRFVMTQAFELPFLCGSQQKMVNLLNTYYPEQLGKFDEFKGVHVVSLFQTSPAQFFTGDKEINTIEDFKGLKIRTGGGTMVQAAELLDIVPVQKPASEMYEILSARIADGTMTPAEVIKSFNLVDLIKQGLIVKGGIAGGAILSFIMNEDKWNQISPEDQKAINAISGDVMGQATAEKYIASDNVSLDAMKAAGSNVKEASAELTAALKQALAPIEAAWIEKARAAGLETPEKVLADIRSACGE